MSSAKYQQQASIYWIHTLILTAHCQVGPGHPRLDLDILPAPTQWFRGRTKRWVTGDGVDECSYPSASVNHFYLYQAENSHQRILEWHRWGLTVTASTKWYKNDHFCDSDIIKQTVLCYPTVAPQQCPSCRWHKVNPAIRVEWGDFRTCCTMTGIHNLTCTHSSVLTASF